jgi:hypothetical protein
LELEEQLVRLSLQRAEMAVQQHLEQYFLQQVEQEGL